MKIDGNQIKIGNILEIQSRLWRVLKTQHTQPGKGGAYLQVELKDIKDGTKINERFRSSESVERVILNEKEFLSLFYGRSFGSGIGAYWNRVRVQRTGRASWPD